MNCCSKAAHLGLYFAFLIVDLESIACAAQPIPFPDALDAAAIEVDRLDSVLNEALILGNGDINALLYSQQGRLQMMLTKNDVWDARLDSQLDPPIPTLDLIRKLGKQPLADGGNAAMLPTGWAQRGADSYHAHPYPCPRACAKLVLGDAAAGPFSARLDLRRAAANVSGPIIADVRAMADRNVFLIRTPASATLEATPSADTPEPALGSESEVRWLTQQMPGDADWPGMDYSVAVAERGEWKAVAIVTSREATDPRSAAIRRARTTLAERAPQLIARHEAEWTKFWAKSGIQIDDSFLSHTWYRNLYFLRCVSKPGVIAPGLFASLINASPAWHGDYHTNYNLQQTFWTAFNTNHPELAEPYDRLMSDYLPRARWLCERIFSFEGAYYPHVIFAYEPPEPELCKSPGGRQYIHHVWGYTMGVPAFTVQPVWWHYKYRPDRKMLERTAYPAVRDVALFQVNFMDRCDLDAEGNLVLGPTVSPEHWGWTDRFSRNRNSTFDIAMFRYVLAAAIDGATILGRDEDLVARWKDALQRLPPYPTTGGDRPVVVDVQGAPPITYNIAIPAVPVFPGDVVTWFSPKPQKELFARSIAKCRWNGNNSAIILSVARARLSMPDALPWMRGEFQARTRPNGTLTLNRLGHPFNDFGHYTEQFAASMAIGELLVQSVGGIIRVFPSWPTERGASFTNLRAEGGFLVSAEQRSRTVTRLEIVSTVGGPLRVLSPWPAIRANGRLLVKDARGIVQLTTEVGERITFADGLIR